MKKALIIIGSLVMVSLIAVGGYGFYLYKSVQSTIDTEMYTTLDREKTDKRDIEVNTEEQEPLSFLLLGTDERSSEQGRSDTLMIITVNPADESMRMVSIPRDTRTEIIGRGFEDKINHAFAFGGADMTIATVENYLDIPIDYFVTVNMQGFKDIVDSVGGVSVQNDFAFDYEGFSFHEGELFLEGDEALAYSRMRYDDPRGDLGRNDRQRQVINELIREGASFSSITRVENILTSIGSNVKTNLAFKDMTTIIQNYSDARHNQETYEIDGSGKRIDGIWYLIVPEEERQRISNELRTHLGLASDPVVMSDKDDEE